MERIFRIFLKCLLIFFALPAVCRGQETIVVEQWKYIPQNEKFFSQIEELRKTKKFYEAIQVSYIVSQDKKLDLLSRIEGKLLLALNLWDVELKATAIEYYKEIIEETPGTFMTQKSLLELSRNLHLVPYYQKDIQNLLNRGAFKEVPNEVDSMIQYFVALDNFEKKEYRWAFESLKKIKPESVWWQNVEFLNGIEFVKNGDFKKAENVLSNLIDKESTHPAIKQISILQKARVYFEQKQYDKSEIEYLKYESRGRDTGRVLYERALSSFYQKKFAFALGLLESLKSENFKTSFNPEQVILEMMIYRELCHYPTVKKIASDFERRFRFLIDYFKTGQDLSKSQILKRIIFQNAKFKNSADLVNQLRKEKKDLKIKHSELNSNIINILSKEIENYEKNYTEIIDKEIQPYLKSTAEFFIEKAEEIRLLEYISGLDEYRIKNIFESREYSSEKSEREKSYNVFYWPVEKEYWWDEYRNYKVLLTDRCNGITVKREGSK